MILSVSHVTQYRYESPVRSLVQSLRLTPSVFAGQRTIDWSISVEGASRGAGFRDGAGDLVESWSLRGPAGAVVIRVEGRVETSDLNGVLQGHRETVPPEVYLRATRPTLADATIVVLARQVADQGGEPLALAHRLSAAISEAIAYRPGVTHAHTTAAEALAQGEGVCQDHAHAMIAAARVLDLPARYVSGYLFSDAEGDAHEAAHAWAEIRLPGLGWVGFDPANRCCPDARYIRLASGFDAQDAAPIRGIARGMVPGAGGESLDVTVAIQSVQQ